MKRWVTALSPLLAWACMVNTDVVGGGPEASVADDLEVRCEALCTRFTECGENESEDCPGDCVDYFTAMFVGRGDACEAGARRLFDCIADASCDELSEENVCNIQSEEDHCAFHNGEVLCRSESISTSADGEPLDCDVGLGECSDNRDYELVCSPDSPDCQCIVGDDVIGRFRLKPSYLHCPETTDAKQICGWPIPNALGDPYLPELVYCASGGSQGSGAPNDCMAIFENCSDGKDRAVICDDSMGLPGCRCMEGDDIVGLPESGIDLDPICPFLQDADG
ncbi:MAG TPA: hypothetical protein VF103_16805, partial [Polyangiaceae bacterium]